jgi:probable phosphoglycerate mutase
MSKLLIIHTDGGSRSNPGPAAYGVAAFFGDLERGMVVGADTEPNSFEIGVLSGYLGIATNNDAEYQGLVAALRKLPEWIQETGAEQVLIRLDSTLVVEQVSGRWKVKQESLKPYVEEARQLIRSSVVPVVLEYVPRAQNARADSLVNKCLDSQNITF